MHEVRKKNNVKEAKKRRKKKDVQFQKDDTEVKIL